MVVLININTVGDVQRLMLSVDSGTRIAFLVSVIPVRFITRQAEVELSRLHLRLLKTEEISV